MSRPPIRLERHPLSGHSHRVELMLSLLGLVSERIDVDLMQGAHKRPEFLARNPFGQVPVIEDDGFVLADSNAILVYLARQYGAEHWLPSEPAAAAAVQRWLSVAAGPLASGPATARLITVFGASYDPEPVIARAHALLGILEAELARSAYLVGDEITIADIALYTYVAHAPEGNVSLEAYPRIRAWLERIEKQPGFVPMQQTAVGLRAGL
ncbi:MAG: glutathione S-transferase [Deltaproteobacteria bacterium]|nr:glutathione S-transferase [Deltaproteobacteria bacterium]